MIDPVGGVQQRRHLAGLQVDGEEHEREARGEAAVHHLVLEHGLDVGRAFDLRMTGLGGGSLGRFGCGFLAREVFAGDGADPGQSAAAPDGEWIELFHPAAIAAEGELNDPTLWQPGVFHTEHLVNMKRHNYLQEPNVRFSPDDSLVIFSSNMFGPSYVFGVEVKKAKPIPVANTR